MFWIFSKNLKIFQTVLKFLKLFGFENRVKNFSKTLLHSPKHDMKILIIKNDNIEINWTKRKLLSSLGRLFRVVFISKNNCVKVLFCFERWFRAFLTFVQCAVHKMDPKGHRMDLKGHKRRKLSTTCLSPLKPLNSDRNLTLKLKLCWKKCSSDSAQLLALLLFT